MNYIRPALNFARWALPTGIGLFNVANKMGYVGRTYNRYRAVKRQMGRKYGRRFGGFRKRRTFKRRPMRRRWGGYRKKRYGRRRYGGYRVPVLSAKRFRNATVTFKRISELSTFWPLNSGQPTTKPHYMPLKSVWIPGIDSNEVAEKTYRNYAYHKLTRISWKVDNIRFWSNEKVFMPKVGTEDPPVYAAVQKTDVKRLYKYKFYYKRNNRALDASAELKPQEEDMTPFHLWGPKSKIWGSVNTATLGYRCVPNKTTFDELQSMTIDQYFTKFLQEPLTNAATPVEEGGTLGFWLMPDDPFPPQVYIDGNSCVLHLIADVTVYTTFSCYDRVIELAGTCKKKTRLEIPPE